jgi:hypothetical protein|tara:strand:+ start:802 stop:1242 length:441 start_codon:yes stop_codon:yes gene_type:complete
MLSFIRSLPFVGIALLFAYGAHSFIVGNLNKTVEQQQMQIDVLNQRNVALESAAQINEQTIKSLEESNSRQIEQIGDLQVANTEYQRQAEEAMAIFRDHDLTILSRRRPNMIEDRANNATKAVFDAVEQDSRDIDKLNNEDEKDNN